MNDQTKKDKWEKKFDDKFVIFTEGSCTAICCKERKYGYISSGVNYEDIKDFIRQTIESVRAEAEAKHDTLDGYCCACNFDIAGFERKIESVRADEREKADEREMRGVKRGLCIGLVNCQTKRGIESLNREIDICDVELAKIAEAIKNA